MGGLGNTHRGPPFAGFPGADAPPFPQTQTQKRPSAAGTRAKPLGTTSCRAPLRVEWASLRKRLWFFWRSTGADITTRHGQGAMESMASLGAPEALATPAAELIADHAACAAMAADRLLTERGPA